MRSGGMTRRSACSGGSVTVKIASTMSSTTPLGRHSRAKMNT